MSDANAVSAQMTALAVGQRWVERCGWRRQIVALRVDPYGVGVVDYDACRGSGSFRRTCSVKAWQEWTRLNHAEVRPTRCIEKGERR